MNAETSFFAALAIYGLHMYMATVLLVLPFGQRHRPSYWRIAVYCVTAVAFCMVFFWPASPVVNMLPPAVLLAVHGLLMLTGFGAAFWLTKAQLWPMLFVSALMGQYLNAVCWSKAISHQHKQSGSILGCLQPCWRPRCLLCCRCFF